MGNVPSKGEKITPDSETNGECESQIGRIELDRDKTQHTHRSTTIILHEGTTSLSCAAATLFRIQYEEFVFSTVCITFTALCP